MVAQHLRIPPARLAIFAFGITLLSGCTGTDTFLGPAAPAIAGQISAGTIATDITGDHATSPLATTGTLRPASLDTSADRNKDIYDQMFPFYAELCALSEIKKKPGFGVEFTSGFGGHSVLYLNGVCRVADAGYPTIQICDGDAAGRGVGLSVNDHFKNTNWVATEGKSFLFYGALKPGEGVNPASYQRTQTEAMRQGILDGVEFHQDFFKAMPAGISRRAYMYELSIATDYATNFGRDHYCARVPMARAQMARAVAYLNAANQPYREGRREFHWNVLSNNCSHLTHNALAAAGIWDPIDIDRPFFVSAFQFPVPKNEFVNLMQRTNDLPLDNPAALFADDTARQSLLQLNYLPVRPGALAEASPIVADNMIYETHPRLIFYDPIGRYQRAFEAMLADPRYFDLATNIRYFAALYQRIMIARRPLAWYAAKHEFTTAEMADFDVFYRQYYSYIEAQGRAAEAQLATLDKMKPATAAPLLDASLGTPPAPGTNQP